MKVVAVVVTEKKKNYREKKQSSLLIMIAFNWDLASLNSFLQPEFLKYLSWFVLDQQPLTCSKLTIETLEKVVKYVQG